MENPTFSFTLPDTVQVTFEPELMRNVDHFIKNESERMLFIYGEYDPWSAPAAELDQNTQSLKAIKPGGHHDTRIHNLQPDQKATVIETIQTWLAAPGYPSDSD